MAQTLMDLTLRDLLYEVVSLIVLLGPAIIGAGVYLWLGPNKFCWDFKTLLNFSISVMAGYAFGQLAIENYIKLKESFWSQAWITALASLFLVEVMRRGYDKIDAFWERLLTLIPSWEQIRELFSNPNKKE
jgi:hypothetical protein